MKPGDVVRGYTILRPFTTTGGGQCMWTFASKDGNEYFLKQFLSPTYPTPDSPGSAALKVRKLDQCNAFEAHHNKLKSALKELASGGGNLIVTKEFFRHEAKYYKVTEKVDTTTLSPQECSELPHEQRILLLKTVAHSLSILHRKSIVHGDLKPANVLTKRTKAGMIAAKLIDFDNSYFENEPPANQEDMVGDVVYYSPEMWRFMSGGSGINASELTVASDIFALGLLYSQYLTGQLPYYDTEKHRYAAEAVNSGYELSLAPVGIDRNLAILICRMLSLSPKDRPTIDEVFKGLREVGKATFDISEPGPAGYTSGRSGLRGSLMKIRDSASGEPESEVAPMAALRGSLIRKREVE